MKQFEILFKFKLIIQFLNMSLYQMSSSRSLGGPQELDRTVKAAPLLLKPNGAPVFRDCELDQAAVTIRKNNQGISQGQEVADLERTVKAHSFVVGKQIQNSTDVKKSAAQEQNFPVKVLYVKPGIVKAERRKASQPVAATGIPKPKQPINEPDLEVSLGEISGIFKKDKKRVQSAPQKEAEKRLKAKKEYAEQVKLQNKIKEEARQRALAERHKSGDAAPKEVQEPKLEMPKPKMPHSQNRFQGKFDSMTKDLFKKAQEKLKEEMYKSKSSQNDQKLKKQREAEIQEQVKLRNREKVLLAKERGAQPMSLKQKEEQRKYEQTQRENNEMREKRRAEAQRSREARARQLAVNNISQVKLAQHQQKKLQEKFELEEQERIQAIVNQQEAMIRQAALNKDIIDFTDPRLGMPSPPEEEQQMPQPDEESQRIMLREARQKALIETRQKRKQQELMKKLAEDEEKQRKAQIKADLELKLKWQREEFAKKQFIQQQKSAREAQDRVKKSKKSQKSGTGKDRSGQLNELRDWIDEQMNIEDVKSSNQNDTLKAPPRTADLPTDPDLLKYQLPGNSLIPLEDERRNQVRDNRYGIDGDNGYDEIAGYTAPPSDPILDFVQHDNQQIEVKSEDSLDQQPVKQEKRKIVNQVIDEPKNFPPPGMLNLKEEAERQKRELLQAQSKAATVLQKWARGWEARRRTNKLRYRTRQDIKDGYTDYTENFKINDKFNLNRFINEKQRLREKYGTDVIDDESISEQIGEASVDIQTESYIKSQILGESSKPAPAMQNFFAPPIKKNMEHDPLSLISLYAKRNTVTATPDQLIPEREKPKQRGKSGSAMVKQQPKEPILHKRSKSGKQQPKKAWDDDISEDIPQSSKAEEQYSENFASDDHITESIPSYKGAQQSESIGESIVVQSGEMKKSSAKISESIPEESAIQSSIVEEDIPEDVIESKEDIISEASYLKQSASSEIKESIAGSPEKVAAPPPKKIERIREKIKEDFDNNGEETFQSVYKAQEIKKQQDQAANERDRQYRMSKQIIQDYEENKNTGSEAHKQIMRDLTEELNRYEKAVNGSIFVEQFQGIVQKNLAQKDIMMLGQRLSQLEMENKHKQEIADIRAEQIRMMSQLMLLNAGGNNLDKKSTENLRLHQEEIMGNIQKLIEKPIVIEKVGLDEEIIESIKESAQMNKQFRASISQSKGLSIKESIIESVQEEIIESDIQESVIDESIQESIQLTNARKVLGSEQTLIQKSKEMLSDKKPRGASPFEKNSFQTYTSDKFKDLLFNDGSMMDEFLDQIEIAVAKKSEKEKQQLKKQLQQKKIDNKTYHKKSQELEKWVTGERAEINQKRRKVKDTVSEIGVFMKKIEQDKQLLMDTDLGSARSTPRKFGQSQGSVSASAMGIRQLQDQLEDVRAGTIGGTRPETKYINKKREYVRQLMIEKKDAIDKGVKDRMKDLENDMVDEMMQAALNLDVDEEIEKRIQMAKQMVEEGRIDESASKSITGSHYKQKKNVKFQTSPKADKYSSSGTSYKQEHESSLRSKSNKIGESMGQDDMIGESIAMEESLGQSSAKKSKVDSSGKFSASKPKSEKIDEENSLSRDSEEIDEDVYSNDFASKSIQSATVSSKKNKQASSMKDQNMEESGYSESFEQMSNLGQSQSQSKGLKSMTNQEFDDIEVVNEEDDEQIVSPEEKTSSKRSPEVSAVLDPTMSDREIVESTRSVQWEIQLQEPRREDSPAPEPVQPSEEEIEEEPTEQYISDEYDVQADEMQDLESNPTGSLAGSYPKEEEDLETRADQITEELLNQIIADFENDQNVKMVVEDDIDEDEFEDKWPYSLDKKVEEPEKPMTPSLPSTQSEPSNPNEKTESDIAKQRHDILLKKYHAEQAMLNDQHLKTKEYLEFITQIVDKEVLQSNLQRPIEHDPLKILEKIQAFDTEDEIEMTNNSQQQSALPSYLFDEIQKRYEEVHTAEKNSDESQDSKVNVSQEAKQVQHLAIFDAFNEALDLERPYKFKGLPNPWSKQTRITKENITSTQVDQIVQKAMERVIGWDATGAGTKFAPAPPPPPLQQDYDAPPQAKKTDEERKASEKQEEDDRNKAERSERLGILLTKEVHQKENDWLDYEIEDTQVRFDLADMILEELADEVTQFLIIKQQPNFEASGGGSSQSYEE